ncbi:hypothetical protein [Pontibacillus salipaludis]|nr:hypothetical protein [Pontibacillus salipaludis]
MNIEQKFNQVAKELLEKRYPTGWGAAATYTNGNEIVTSVAEIPSSKPRTIPLRCFETRREKEPAGGER